MSNENKPQFPIMNPFGWILRASLMLLGSVIALNFAIAFLRPILPWIIGGLTLAATVWATVGVIRWRRSKW